MALATTLHLVRPIELGKLKAQPTWINRFSPPGEATYSTYYFGSLNYFVTGDAWPSGSRAKPLGGMLFGFASVKCPTLENGNFGVVEPAQVRWVLQAMTGIDLAAFRNEIQEADPDELDDEEVTDFELLVDEDQAPADLLESELVGLVEFYKRAAHRRCGIVMYTT